MSAVGSSHDGAILQTGPGDGIYLAAQDGSMVQVYLAPARADALRALEGPRGVVVSALVTILAAELAERDSSRA